jgi:glycosyltransferase involved in cell wall biosynthesis
MKTVILMARLGKPSTFIQRRISAAANHGIDLMVEIEGEKPQWMTDQKIKTVENYQGKSVKSFLYFWIGLVLKPKITFQYFRFFREKEKRNYWGSTVKTGALVPLFFMKKVDIIHVQWTYSAPFYRILANHYKATLLTSVRGSQVTISPQISEKANRYLKESIQSTDYFHCVSQSMKDAILAHGATQPCFVNYNGIQLHKFSPVPFHEKSKKFKIISVGLMIWRKNFIMALQVAFELKKRNIDFEWHFYGKGVERNALFYLTSKMNLQDHVYINHAISEQELIPQFQKSHALVSTSAGEGLANVVVEAMACGVVPVVWDCEGMLEAIEDHFSGFVLPFGDIASMADALEELSKNRKKCEEMSINAVDRMKNHFDESVHSKKMMEWYQRIMEETHRSRT